MARNTSAIRDLFLSTVRRVEMAYAATGWKPIRYMLFNPERDSGCALGVVMQHETNGRWGIVASYGCDCGIADGFNGSQFNYPGDAPWLGHRIHRADYSLGFAIGRYVAKRVFAPAPKEPACEQLVTV